MSIITTYPLIGDVAPADLLIIADMSILGTPTRTVSIQQLVDELGGSYSWFVGGTGGFEVTASETVTFTGGIKLTAVNNSGNQSVTFNHDNTSRTDTTSAVTPGSGGTFTVIDSIVQDATGHTTLVNTKTVTMPSGGGGSGSVTSVSASTEGDALDVFVSDPTTTPDLAFTWAGTNNQYINGAGDLVTLPATATTYNLDADQAGLNVDLRLTPSTGSADVVKFTAGGGITLTETGNNNITIAASGSGGLTSVGASSNYLTIANSPLTSNGVIQVNMPANGVPVGTYTNATVTVDQYGFVTNASSGSTIPSNIVETVTTTDGQFIELTPNSPTSGAVAVTADLSATGTPSSTTFLRGDNTWAAPSGGGGTTYDLASAQDGANVDITLTPSTGAVDTVQLTAGTGITLADDGNNNITIISAASGTGLWTATGNDIYNNNSNAVVIGKTSAATDTASALEVSGRISIEGVGNSVYVGELAGVVATGVNNTALGRNAMLSNTTGTTGVAIGTNALRSNVDGSFNVAVGADALYQNISGALNTAVGDDALINNISGDYNVAVGGDALKGNTIGNQNIAIGNNAYQSSTGTNNVAIGYQAGSDLVTGNENIHIGSRVGNASVNVTNEIVIGYLGVGNGSNTTTLGTVFTTETHLKGVVVLDGYTFATLPASPVVGMRTYITDGGTPTYGGNASGGGSNKLPVFYNGSNWIYA